MVTGQARCGRLGGVTVDARVEHVGSLLRPGFLRDARAAHELLEKGGAGKIVLTM